MWHELVGRVDDLFATLVEIDETVAAQVRAGGCECGGRLHRADYPRKPRGLPANWEAAYSKRISFCCGREGCRRRKTPPSVRFLGRRVYVGALVLAAAGQWVRPRAAQVPGRTVRRWRGYFRQTLVQLALWPVLRARLMPPPNESELPRSLLQKFVGDRHSQLIAVLKFLSPMTVKLSTSVMVG